MGVAKDQLVYVVDDDEAVRESTCALLESERIAASCHATGEEFLSQFDAQRAGCLILDVHMPQMSGLELLNRLRARGVATPAIILTGRRDPAFAAMAKRAGVLALLDKPPDDEQLLTLVRAALQD